MIIQTLTTVKMTSRTPHFAHILPHFPTTFLERSFAETSVKSKGMPSFQFSNLIANNWSEAILFFALIHFINAKRRRSLRKNSGLVVITRRNVTKGGVRGIGRRLTWGEIQMRKADKIEKEVGSLLRRKLPARSKRDVSKIKKNSIKKLSEECPQNGLLPFEILMNFE